MTQWSHYWRHTICIHSRRAGKGKCQLVSMNIICVLFPYFLANERAHNFFNHWYLTPPVQYHTYHTKRNFSCKSFCMVVTSYSFSYHVTEVLTIHFLVILSPSCQPHHEITLHEYYYWSRFANANSDNLEFFVAVPVTVSPWNFNAFENRTNFNSGMSHVLFVFTVTCHC